MPKRSNPRAGESWSACKTIIKSWPAPGLIALVQELYKLSPDNRRFLHARLFPEQAQHSLDDTTKRLRRMLAPDEIFNGPFRHADLKRIVDQFQKAVDDRALVAQLLLSDLAASFACFNQVGDFVPIVDHAYATMNRLDKCLQSLDPSALPPLVQRLTEIADRWSNQFGYDLSDELDALANEWRTRLNSTNCL